MLEFVQVHPLAVVIYLLFLGVAAAIGLAVGTGRPEDKAVQAWVAFFVLAILAALFLLLPVFVVVAGVLTVIGAAVLLLGAPAAILTYIFAAIARR